MRGLCQRERTAVLRSYKIFPTIIINSLLFEDTQKDIVFKHSPMVDFTHVHFSHDIRHAVGGPRLKIHYICLS